MFYTRSANKKIDKLQELRIAHLLYITKTSGIGTKNV